MIIAADIGNTNIVIGFIANSKVIKVFRIATDRGRTSDEYKLLISLFTKEEHIANDEISDFVVSSVVPPLVPIFKSVAKKLLGKEAFVITPQVNLGFKLCVDEPYLIGTEIKGSGLETEIKGSGLEITVLGSVT